MSVPSVSVCSDQVLHTQYTAKFAFEEASKAVTAEASRADARAALAVKREVNIIISNYCIKGTVLDPSDMVVSHCAR